MPTNEMICAIDRAISQGDLPELIRLIEKDNTLLFMSDVTGTLLQAAANRGKLELVRWLVAQGADIDAYDELNLEPPLCLAAANGYFDVVKFLIKSGASLDVSDSIRNPLISVILGGLSDSHTAIAKLLIDSGIDTNIRYPNLQNMNALEFADQWGRMDIVALLRSKESK